MFEPMTVRDPYITTKTLSDIRGMYEFIDRGKVEKPLKVIRPPAPKELHILDGHAALLGLTSGEEMDMLESYASDNLDNPAILKAYRDLLMVSKLNIDGDKLAVARRRAQKREDDYQGRVRNYQYSIESQRAKMEEVERQRKEASENSSSRWQKTVNSVLACMVKNPALYTMSPTDQATMITLVNMGYLLENNGVVSGFEEARMRKWDRTEIFRFIDATYYTMKSMGLISALPESTLQAVEVDPGDDVPF